MSDPRSVSRCIAALKAGDDQAASALWERYFDKLVRLAHSRLHDAPRRVADEEDVALSVFRCLCDGATGGRFEWLSDRDDLWRLLVTITRQKAIDQRRRWSAQKRSCGENQETRLDRIASDEPSADLLIAVAEQHQVLLARLKDEGLRRTALLRMEGQTNQEIAQELGITPRSVERKLQRIRGCWSRELKR